MAEKSEVEWTDSTVNFWWGCTKVGPGCDHCYAESWSKRTGERIWGAGIPRRKIKGAVALLKRLDNKYAEWRADFECARGNSRALGLPVPNIQKRRRVFIQSMSDLFDLEVPLAWFAEAWLTIEACHRLNIQIVTKRISAVEKRLAETDVAAWPQHAGLIITVCNQAEADRDVRRLLDLKAKLGIPWVGLSIEPMLGPVDLRHLLRFQNPGLNINALTGVVTRGQLGMAPGECSIGVTGVKELPALDWVICGGESGPHARPMHPDWARSLRDQCKAACVPFYFKQHGEWSHRTLVEDTRQDLPSSLHYFPDHDATYAKVGKKAAGRFLDGVLHDGMPV